MTKASSKKQQPQAAAAPAIREADPVQKTSQNPMQVLERPLPSVQDSPTVEIWFLD